MRRVGPALAAMFLVASTALAGPAPAVAGGVRGVTSLPEGFSAMVVDPATGRVFVSSDTANVVTVLDPAGAVLHTLAVPGAGDLLVDGPILYVVSTTGGRIDAFDTATMSLVRSYGSLNQPSIVVKAGGRLWTTTGGCGALPRLVSIDMATGVTTTHPLFGERQHVLYYCPRLFPSTHDPNVVLAFDVGISPPTLVRLDVSAESPVVTAASQISGATRDGAMLPDGRTFAIASTAKGLETFSVDSLQSTGTYQAGGSAIDVTGANGGLLAVGGTSLYGLDLQVFRMEDPSTAFFARDLGPDENVYERGLAFSPDGTRLYVVGGDYFRRTPHLSVIEPSDHRGRFAAVTPARILDTRTTNGNVARSVRPGETIDVQVTGRGGVPAERVGAVAMNVTVTEPTAGGHLTVFPTGDPRPATSNLNFSPGKTVPNLVVTEVGAGGRVSIYNSAGNTHVIFDVTGWYSNAVAGDGGRLVPLVPSRLVDTCDGTGGGVRLGPRASLDVQVTGRAGVPDTGAAVDPVGGGFLTVWPAGYERPLASDINFTPGETRPNLVVIPFGQYDAMNIYSSATTHLVADVVGWTSLPQ